VDEEVNQNKNGEADGTVLFILRILIQDFAHCAWIPYS